jgi:hypothetical protein
MASRETISRKIRTSKRTTSEAHTTSVAPPAVVQARSENPTWRLFGNMQRIVA